MLLGAAALLLRQTVGRGGQPETPVQPVPPSAGGNGRNARGSSITVQPVAATSTPRRHTGCRRCRSRHPGSAAGCPHPGGTACHRDLYEQNPDLIGWLTIDGTDIDLPVVQTPGNNEYYLRRGFDRLSATGGTLFMDEHCPSIPMPHRQLADLRP